MTSWFSVSALHLVFLTSESQWDQTREMNDQSLRWRNISVLSCLLVCLYVLKQDFMLEPLHSHLSEQSCFYPACLTAVWPSRWWADDRSGWRKWALNYLMREIRLAFTSIQPSHLVSCPEVFTVWTYVVSLEHSRTLLFRWSVFGVVWYPAALSLSEGHSLTWMSPQCPVL